MNSSLKSLYKEENTELEDNVQYIVFDQGGEIIFEGIMEELKGFFIELKQDYLKETYYNRKLELQEEFEDIATVVNSINKVTYISLVCISDVLFLKELLKGYQMKLFVEV